MRANTEKKTNYAELLRAEFDRKVEARSLPDRLQIMKEVSEKSGVPASTIKAILGHPRNPPTLELVAKICDALGLSASKGGPLERVLMALDDEIRTHNEVRYLAVNEFSYLEFRRLAITTVPDTSTRAGKALELDIQTFKGIDEKAYGEKFPSDEHYLAFLKVQLCHDIVAALHKAEKDKIKPEAVIDPLCHVLGLTKTEAKQRFGPSFNTFASPLRGVAPPTTSEMWPRFAKISGIEELGLEKPYLDTICKLKLHHTKPLSAQRAVSQLSGEGESGVKALLVKIAESYVGSNKLFVSLHELGERTNQILVKKFPGSRPLTKSYFARLDEDKAIREDDRIIWSFAEAVFMKPKERTFLRNTCFGFRGCEGGYQAIMDAATGPEVVEELIAASGLMKREIVSAITMDSDLPDSKIVFLGQWATGKKTPSPHQLAEFAGALFATELPATAERLSEKLFATFGLEFTLDCYTEAVYKATIQPVVPLQYDSRGRK